MMSKLAIGAILLGGVVAVACGGSGSKDSGSSAQTAPAQQASSEAQVKSAPAADVKADTKTVAKAEPAKGKVNPCALVTKAEAEAAIGEPVDDGQVKDGAAPLGQTICWYGASAEISTGFVQISVVQNDAMAPELKKRSYTAKQLFTDTRAAYTGAAPLTGIGDDAFLGRGEVQVLKGDVQMSIMAASKRLGDPTATATTDALTTLARSAVTRIGR